MNSVLPKMSTYTPAKFQDGQFGMESTGDKSCVICVGSTVSGQIFLADNNHI